jgi:hypothetical protein
MGAAGYKRGDRQSRPEVLCAICRARAERSEADRKAFEAGGDCSVRLRLKRDLTAQPGADTWRESLLPFLGVGSGHLEPLSRDHGRAYPGFVLGSAAAAGNKRMDALDKRR